MNFKISSPAKINLGLKVLNKRKDNFHNIKTIFQFLDWGDKIYIENEVSETEIICKEIEHEKNIIFELFRILKKEINFDGIYFRKDIGHQVRKNFSKEN